MSLDPVIHQLKEKVALLEAELAQAKSEVAALRKELPSSAEPYQPAGTEREILACFKMQGSFSMTDEELLQALKCDRFLLDIALNELVSRNLLNNSMTMRSLSDIEDNRRRSAHGRPPSNYDLTIDGKKCIVALRE